MVKLTIADFDDMYSLVLDLGIITYLQQLVELDSGGSSAIFQEGNENARECAFSYLLDLQFETLMELKKQFDKDEQ